LNQDVQTLQERVKRREDKIKRLEAKGKISNTILHSYISSDVASDQ